MLNINKVKLNILAYKMFLTHFLITANKLENCSIIVGINCSPLTDIKLLITNTDQNLYINNIENRKTIILIYKYKISYMYIAGDVCRYLIYLSI